MLNIKVFTVNSFQENTYVLSDESKECIIIDAGFQTESERKTFRDYLQINDLKPVMSLHTHAHVDHMFGAPFLIEQFNLGYRVHSASQEFIDRAKEYASVFGIIIEKVYQPEAFIKDEELLSFGNTSFRAIYTPGHADGSVCFYFEADGVLFSGDLLFKDSIGRTDLPTGNYDTLKSSILKLFKDLPAETKVFAGHGPSTTLGHEAMYNPFI
ncbi:MAG: MBL fold metallo-hydrolase [Bacteroidales bacterium]|jgi:glyoxylase-like metal-dependent hydrolase (beta-lactamase superfamily II)|nr:MBL fold metallo-hydrolase [Bacteroidales bacterium]